MRNVIVILASLAFATMANADPIELLIDRCQEQALPTFSEGEYLLPPAEADFHTVWTTGNQIKVEGVARPYRYNRSGYAVEYACDFKLTPEDLYAQTKFRRRLHFDRKWKADRPQDECPEDKACGPLLQRLFGSN